MTEAALGFDAHVWVWGGFAGANIGSAVHDQHAICASPDETKASARLVRVRHRAKHAHAIREQGREQRFAAASCHWYAVERKGDEFARRSFAEQDMLLDPAG